MDSFVFIPAFISRSRLQWELERMISIKTGCCLKASSCQAELPRWHRHHNRGCPSHNSVWLAQGENGSLWRARPAAGWQACICEARRGGYLLSFRLLHVSLSSARMQREQSDKGNIVRGVKKPIRAYNICVCVSYTSCYFKKKVFWITVTWYARSNDKILCCGPTRLTLNTRAKRSHQRMGCVSDRSGGLGEKCPLGVLIMALLLPFAVTVARGGQDKRKAMFHLCCLGISNSKGTKRDRDSVLLQWREEEEILMEPPFSTIFLYLPPFFFLQLCLNTAL